MKNKTAQLGEDRIRGSFQSPRGDFGFLKAYVRLDRSHRRGIKVSIPSRGFWFFEEMNKAFARHAHRVDLFQSPRGDFGFLKPLFRQTSTNAAASGFNPLAGILVF